MRLLHGAACSLQGRPFCAKRPRRLEQKRQGAAWRDRRAAKKVQSKTPKTEAAAGGRPVARGTSGRLQLVIVSFN